MEAPPPQWIVNRDINMVNYLRRGGGYIFITICLFVSRITQKLLDGFSQNSVEG